MKKWKRLCHPCVSHSLSMVGIELLELAQNWDLKSPPPPIWEKSPTLPDAKKWKIAERANAVPASLPPAVYSFPLPSGERLHSAHFQSAQCTFVYCTVRMFVMQN